MKMIVDFILIVCVGFLVSGLAGLLSIVRRNRHAASAALTALAGALWTIFIIVFLATSDAIIAGISVKIYYAAAALIPLFCLMFAKTYQKKTFNKIPYIIASILITALCFFPGLLFSTLNIENHTVVLNLVPYSIYCVYFTIFFILAFFKLLSASNSRAVQKSMKHQLRHSAAAWFFGGVIGSTFNLFLPLFGNYSLIYIGPLSMILFIIIMFIAATTNEYFSAVKTFLKGFIYCFITVLIVAGGYFALTFIGRTVEPDCEITWKRYIISGATLLVSLLWIFVLSKVAKFVIKKLDSDGYNEREILHKMSSITVQNHGVKDFFSAVRHTLDKGFGVERVDVVIFEQGTAVHMDDHHLENALVRITAGKSPTTIYREEIKNHSDYTIVTAHNIEVITPIIGTINNNNNNNNNKIIGVLLLSPRRRRFSRFYGDTLEKVSAILSPFIQSAVFYEQINGFNTKLKHEIAEKTRKLRENNKELRQIDNVKDDMLSIASHQLRTPLTGVIGYTDMLYEGDFGELNDEQKAILSQVIRSGRDMNKMLLDYLDVTRIDMGRFELHKEKFNLTELVNDEIRQLQDMAAEHGRQLIYHADETPIEITGDATRFRQVVVNLVDNAIYYGKDKVMVDLHKIGRDIIFTVKDDGIGVPKSEQNRLFTKMFRASNAKQYRPDGSGIGLYVIHSIIEESGGQVIFESEENRGSIFGFKI